MQSKLVAAHIELYVCVQHPDVYGNEFVVESVWLAMNGPLRRARDYLFAAVSCGSSSPPELPSSVMRSVIRACGMHQPAPRHLASQRALGRLSLGVVDVDRTCT